MLNTTEHVISIAHKKFCMLVFTISKLSSQKNISGIAFKYLMSVFSVCSQNVL